MIDDAPNALLHFEVEANYGGWTLLDYLAEKLKRPLAPALLELAHHGADMLDIEHDLGAFDFRLDRPYNPDLPFVN